MLEADRAEINPRDDNYFVMIDAMEKRLREMTLPSPAPRPAAPRRRPVVPGMAIAAGMLVLAGAVVAGAHFPTL